MTDGVTPTEGAHQPVGHDHRYAATIRWEGSTGPGYDAYDRAHTAQAPPAAAEVALSADPAFRGDPARLNPEQLMVLAASSCQLLSFLAVAARARLDVVAYADDAEAEMPHRERPDPQPMWIERIVLRPRVTIRVVAGEDPPSEDRVVRLMEVAHRECFIANSLRTEIRLEPAITIVSVP